LRRNEVRTNTTQVTKGDIASFALAPENKALHILYQFEYALAAIPISSHPAGTTHLCLYAMLCAKMNARPAPRCMESTTTARTAHLSNVKWGCRDDFIITPLSAIPSSPLRHDEYQHHIIFLRGQWPFLFPALRYHAQMRFKHRVAITTIRRVAEAAGPQPVSPRLLTK